MRNGTYEQNIDVTENNGMEDVEKISKRSNKETRNIRDERKPNKNLEKEKPIKKLNTLPFVGRSKLFMPRFIKFQ